MRIAVLVVLLAAVFVVLRVLDQPGLAVALYSDHYCLLPAGMEQSSSETAAAFLAKLRAANPVAARYQDGWTVLRADANGVWIADATQQRRGESALQSALEVVEGNTPVNQKLRETG